MQHASGRCASSIAAVRRGMLHRSGNHARAPRHAGRRVRLASPAHWRRCAPSRRCSISVQRAPPRRTATVSTTGMPSRRFELADIDDDAAPARRIHHVQCQHHRPAQTAHLEHEAQMQAQVGRIGDADDHIGRGLAREVAEADVARDRFVRAGRFEAVGAGQVEQLELAPRRRAETALPCARPSRRRSWRPSAGRRSAG